MKIPERDRIASLFWRERELWQQGARYIAGVDEAGRGPLAGPVVAAAVIFGGETFISDINDSKLLSPAVREKLYPRILHEALCVSLGEASVSEIDTLNILRATQLAMSRALQQLAILPDYVLVDGAITIPGIFSPQEAIIHGDRRCFSIAAASIVAKVYRDRLMQELHRQYPHYRFDQHKGYGTSRHLEAIHQFGRCEMHRQSFRVKGLDAI